jgi:glycosyltransferase involved in cell wall biosynthesis
VPRHDVTIYCPTAAGYFRRGQARGAGMERQVLLLARELSRRGFRVCLVVHRVGSLDAQAAGGLTLVERGPRGSARGIRGTVVEAWRVLRALRAADGAVVVVTGGTPVLGFVAAYCRARRRRLVFAAHSDLDFEVGKPQKIIRRRWLYRAGVRLADVVVVLTRAQAELAKEAFPALDGERIRQISSFATSGGASSELPVEFLWAGRLHDVKRPLLYADLAAAMPEASFGLVALVPPEPPSEAVAYSRRLAALSAELPNLSIVGPMPYEDLQERMARAVALVNTSSHEGMPSTFLEAWALGVPVLTLEVDPDGVIAERGLGVAAAGSWERFLAGARELWEQRGDRSALSGRAQRYVREVHAPEAVGAQWADLLGKLQFRRVRQGASRPARAEG